LCKTHFQIFPHSAAPLDPKKGKNLQWLHFIKGLEQTVETFFMKNLLASRATRRVCEQNRPKYGQIFFSSKNI
jgi:hypothetical protein